MSGAKKLEENPRCSEDDEEGYDLWEEEKEFQEPKIPEEFDAPPTPPPVSLRGRTLQFHLPPT